MSNKGSGYTDKNFVKTREISRAECSLSGLKKAQGTRSFLRFLIISYGTLDVISFRMPHIF